MQHPTPRVFTTTVLLYVCVATPTGSARAQSPDTLARRLPPVVTITRGSARSPLELPYGISSVSPDSLRPGQTHAFAEQTFFQLPGVTVANRTNPSQDTRIVIRGFGARSQFGARSIRIVRDGMPLTLPDGQTPIDYLDLESIGRIEVIRGTAASLYGNASGGVLDLHSVRPPDVLIAPEVRLFRGSGALQRFTAVGAGRTSDIWYQGNVGRTTADNFRRYSAQKLTNYFGRVGGTARGFAWSVTAMGLDMPLAQNPGALTAAQADSNPRMADPLSERKLARKEVEQIQIGASATRTVAAGELTASLYGGTRSLYNPLTFAVVGIDRSIAGASARFLRDVGVFGRHVSLTAGAETQRLDDDRKNWANCNAAAVSASCPAGSGEKGALSLDQRELVTATGAFARAEMTAGAFRGSAGVRGDVIDFDLTDHYTTDGRDDSGSRSMSAISPMAGVSARLGALHATYLNVSTAFETPTTTELGNHADGTAGLNPDLDPQSSTTLEWGVKGLAASRFVYDASIFTTRVRDELIAFEVPGGLGRTYYRNAGRTKREGGELALSTNVDRLELAGALTISRFRFVDFAVGTNRYDGKRIPGVPEYQAQVSATWRADHWFAVVEQMGKSKVWVNDANAAAAGGFDVTNVRIGFDVTVAGARLMPMFGAQNLLDKEYVGSVAINAAGTVATGKFYEPAAGPTWFIGLQAGWAKQE